MTRHSVEGGRALISRRGAIGLLAIVFGTLSAPVRALAAACKELVAADAGPFYPVEPIPEGESLISGAAPAQGTPLYVLGRVVDRACLPVGGADVEIWQCDAGGQYKHPAAPKTKPLDPHFMYFAKVRSAADGAFRFRTIRPVSYAAFGIKRAPHIHVRVKTAGRAGVTTEIYFAGHEDDQLRIQDRVFQSRGARRGEMIVALRPAGELAERLASTPEHGALACACEVMLPAALDRDQETTATAQAFAGAWTLDAKMGDQPVQMHLELAVKDDTIAGWLLVDHAGKLEVEKARITGGVLTFLVSASGAAATTEFTARLGSNGETLVGSLDGPMGKVDFAGTRAQAQR